MLWFRFLARLMPVVAILLFVSIAVPMPVWADATTPTATTTPPPALPLMSVMATQTLGKGLVYQKIRVALPNVPVHYAYVLRWNPTASEFRLMPILPTNQLRGLRSVRTTLQQVNAVAGINASFFNTTLGYPLGLVIQDGELLSGSLFNRVALGVPNGKGLPRFERVDIQGNLRFAEGSQIQIDTFNQPRVDSSHVVLYTRLWGTQSPPANSETYALRFSEGVLNAVSADGPLPIGTEDWVVFGPKDKLKAGLNPLLNGLPVELSIRSTPDWTSMGQAVGGGPYLLKDGSEFIDGPAQRFGNLPKLEQTSRTAIGLTPQKELVLVVTDKRPGTTLPQMAIILKELGCNEAMNLDGGSSSQMVVQGNVVSAAIPGGGGVSTALGFVKVAPVPQP